MIKLLSDFKKLKPTTLPRHKAYWIWRNGQPELFERAEVDEKRQLIKLLFSTVHIEGTNIVYNVQKPFDLLLACAEEQDVEALVWNIDRAILA